MNIDEVKQYLGQYRLLDAKISSKIEQRNRYISLATSMSPSYGDSHSSGVSDKIGTTVSKIVDLENEIIKCIDKLVDLKRDIEVFIDSVGDEKLRELLELHYINGKTWEQVAEELNISYRCVYLWHNQALQKIILQ